MWYKENNEYDANFNNTRHRCYDLVDTSFVLYEDIKQSFDNDNIMTSKVWYNISNYDVPPTLNYADSTLYYFDKVLGQKDLTPANGLTIYPTPTTGLVKIVSQLPVISAELYNLSGIRLAQYSANTTEVNLNWLTAGTYVLRTITKQGVYCNKVLVQ